VAESGRKQESEVHCRFAYGEVLCSPSLTDSQDIHFSTEVIGHRDRSDGKGGGADFGLAGGDPGRVLSKHAAALTKWGIDMADDLRLLTSDHISGLSSSLELAGVPPIHLRLIMGEIIAMLSPTACAADTASES